MTVPSTDSATPAGPAEERPAPTSARTALPDDPSVLDAHDVADRLGTDPETGLTTTEAAGRLATDGPNELTAVPPTPAWRRFLGQFADPLIYLLTAAVVIAVAAWAIEGAHGLPFDAIVIVAIMILNAILGFVQESRAEQAVAALQRMSAPMATVRRDGRPVQVPAREVVVGDLLLLGEGDTVAADARLVGAAALHAAEASLTGESVPVVKNPSALAVAAPLGDRTNMVFSGTAVTQGVGRGVVTATGMSTETGRIADMLQATKEDPTPLQREMRRVSVMLGWAVVAIAVVVVIVILVAQGVSTLDEAVQVLLLAVSLAVAAVPEGLIAILSVVLALGVQRMAGRGAIVKRLSSVETLGSASVICSDKTGTLTRNEMTVQRVVTASGGCDVTGTGYAPVGGLVDAEGVPLAEGPLSQEVMAVLRGGALVNDATLRDVDGEWVITGDPTEAALVVAARKAGASGGERYTRIAEVPFTSERKRMTTVAVDAEREDRLSIVSKGAPDVLLGYCTRLLVGDTVRDLTDADRTTILATVDDLSDGAYRTLAVAYRETDETGLGTDDVDAIARDLESGLVFAGMVGIIDPPRAEVAAAIDEAHRAGIRTVMITGDHPRTAARIATDLGIVEAGGTALTGQDLDALDEAGLSAAVHEVGVYARVAPQHKLQIVDALQARGEVVAMTGDGVNDAPALKSADIGVAMGITGTEVTKEAAKMILTDDDFATIVSAVREGRGIFANIRKFLRYLLSSNVGEVLTVFCGVLFAGVLGFTGSGAEAGIVVPLLATQILWINLLTDSAPAMAMGVDPQTDDVMASAPRGRGERVIDSRMWIVVAITGLTMAVVTLLGMDLHLAGGLVTDSGHLAAGGFEAQFTEARTVGFTVLVFAQLFNALACRSEMSSAFVGLFANRWLWAAIGLSLLLQVAVIHVPALNTAFGTVPLTGGQWLQAVGLASIVLVVSEAVKVVLRARAGRSRPSATAS